MSISERAVIVQLSCTAFHPDVSDNSLREDLTNRNRAERSSAVVLKYLGGKEYRRILREPMAIVKNGRDDLHKLGASVGRGRGDLIPVDHIPELRAKNETQKAQFYAAVEKAEELFTTRRSEFLAAEQRRLGDMYSEDDYPATIRHHYSWNLSIEPVSAEGSLILALADEDLKWAQEAFEEARAESLRAANQGLVDRLGKQLGDLAAILAKYTRGPDGKLRSRLSDSHIDGLRETVSLMPAIADLFGDADLAEAVEDVRRNVTAYDTDDIKEDDALRVRVMHHANRIADSLTTELSAAA